MAENQGLFSNLPALGEGYYWSISTGWFMGAGDELLVRLMEESKPINKTIAKKRADFDGNDDSYVVSAALEILSENPQVPRETENNTQTSKNFIFGNI